jgi:hypothetical protein
VPSPSISLRDIFEEILASMRLHGVSTNFMTDITAAITSFDYVEKVTTTDYLGEVEARPELRERATQWLKDVWEAVLPPLFLKLGKVATLEETKGPVDDMKFKIDENVKAGIVFGMPFVTLVVRKKAKV